MFPFPDFINVRISTMLQLISSKLGVFMLHYGGMSAYREGNVIDLGFTQLQVVEACSGLRYVLPLMVLSLILAYWFKAHIWKRAFLFLSSIPLGNFCEQFPDRPDRHYYTACLAPKSRKDSFTDFPDGSSLSCVIPVFLGEMWVLRRLPPKSVDALKRVEERGRGEEGRRGYEAGGNRWKVLGAEVYCLYGDTIAYFWDCLMGLSFGRRFLSIGLSVSFPCRLARGEEPQK